MDALRYGWWHLLLMAAATCGLFFLAITLVDVPLSPIVLGVMGALSFGVLAFDLLIMPVRVMKDFRRGNFSASAYGTRFLRSLSLSEEKKAGYGLNLAASHLAMGDYETGGSYLREVQRDDLTEALRAVWENNYAYFILGSGGDPEEALTVCDTALASGAVNPAFHGTRGLALLKLGRLDDAIAELCRSMEVGHLGPAGLAETYYYLGCVWERKGEMAYARDHLLKAINVAPDSPYGHRAAEALNRHLKL